MNNINICIVHYNTPKLTECLIKSINKYTPNCNIFIFDNSDEKPFTYKQDNITIFDNTHGQIINFDSFLLKSPNKPSIHNADHGRQISVRHCISVDKCFNLINDNFILLDSDILLKRDISDIFDNNYMWVGYAEQQHNLLFRVTPYMCYINVKMCKEARVKYFDERKMHGWSVGAGNKYDTGASFYYNTLNYPHKIVNINNYITHYKGASWDPNNKINIKYHPRLSVDQWLKKFKHLYSKNKNVIYTCVTGNYEKLYNPTTINEDFDYICFTDNPDCVKGDIWEIREIPNELKSLSNVKQQRVIKICPHKYLSEYELSVWVDGSIDITGNINNLLTSIFENDKSVYIPKHPHRRCIYDEAIVCIKLKKDIIDNIDPQIYRYSKDSFPKYNGLVQTGIIIRKHNDNYCVNLMEMWKNELINGSHRDQLSFNYCLWKLGDNGFKYLDKTLFMSIYFKLYKHRERCEHLDTKNNVKQTINQTSKSKYIMVGNRLIRKK